MIKKIISFICISIISISLVYADTSAGTNYILDQYPSNLKITVSLTKLKSSVVKCIKVRRSSDNFEQEFSYDLSGKLDLASLSAFVGTGATDQGYVTIWYSQIDSNNFTQTSGTLQPQIVIDGVVVVDNNGNPSIQFDGVNDNLISTSAISISDTHTLHFVYSKPDDVRRTLLGCENVAGIGQWESAVQYSTTYGLGGALTIAGVYVGFFNDISILNTTKVITFSRNGLVAPEAYRNNIYLNRSVVAASNETEATAGNAIRRIGRRDASQQFFNGKISTIIVRDEYNVSTMQTLIAYLKLLNCI